MMYLSDNDNNYNKWYSETLIQQPYIHYLSWRIIVNKMQNA